MMQAEETARMFLFLFLLHNWQIMPFGHITPDVHVEISRETRRKEVL